MSSVIMNHFLCKIAAAFMEYLDFLCEKGARRKPAYSCFFVGSITFIRKSPGAITSSFDGQEA
jgi:hypothetical protein